MLLRLLVVTLLWLLQPTTRPAGQEPGDAESRQRSGDAPLVTTFTHRAVELRGVWLASRDMTAPKDTLVAKLDALKSANFNTVLIDTYFKGFVVYPGGKIVPQAPEFRDKPDVLAMLIDECHQRGIRADLWMEYGFYGYFTADATKDKSMGPILDAHPELLSVDADGTRFIHRGFGDFYSMCPSNPKSHEILAQIYAEAVTKYPQADGVNLDRIRYADANYCYCDYCKEHFRAETAIELKKFTERSNEAKKFLDWKRRQTTKAVETIAKAVRAARPGIVITSYVVGPAEMDSKSQGWDLWMQANLLDGVAVSMYGPDIRPAARRAIELLGPHRDKLIAAISCDQKTPIYLSNIEISRSLGNLGQITWHLGDLNDDIEALWHGPYSTPAKSSLGQTGP
jgi:uncharacterized lipoprotein YddW (UPF0748 family)